MIDKSARDSSVSLRNQVSRLENQLILRRQRMQDLKAAANQKMSAKLTSPVLLLAAAGAGAAMEQAGHERDWSLAHVIRAANTGIGLLVMLTSFGQQMTGSPRQSGS